MGLQNRIFRTDQPLPTPISEISDPSLPEFGWSSSGVIETGSEFCLAGRSLWSATAEGKRIPLSGRRSMQMIAHDV
jgi:hypothetical protein